MQQALKAAAAPSSAHPPPSMIPTRTPNSFSFQKPNFLFPFQPSPPHYYFPQKLRRNRVKFHLFSTSCSTISTEPIVDSPAAPEIETHGEEEEKFDWYAHWYPILPVCDLDKRVPHAKRVMGLDVVVWWDRNQGKWQVFDDSCPHRLAPLSEGRIDQWGRLQCVYHGWCFSGDGDCKFIPQAPTDGPPVHTFKKACAAVYPCYEQNKIVWFWPSTEPQYKDIMVTGKPPYIAQLDDPSYSCLMGNRDIPYGYEVLTENLMDPAHVPYAHYGIMRADREGGKPMEINVQTSDINGFSSKQENGHSKFTAPCVFSTYANFGTGDGPPFSVNSEEGTSTTVKQRKIILIFFCIPVSPGKSRVIWAFPRNFGLWVDRVVPRWIFHVGQNLILDSDLYLLHLEEHKLIEAGNSNWQKACFVPTKSDALVVAFRKWLRKYSGSQIEWGTKFKGPLPPTPPKEQLMDRYWSHVVNCSSCRVALKGLKAAEVAMQLISIAAIAIVAAMNSGFMSTGLRTAVVSLAVLCFAASKWLSHFIYKNFYFHDYNHGLR